MEINMERYSHKYLDLDFIIYLSINNKLKNYFMKEIKNVQDG